MKVPNYRYSLILSSLIAALALGGCKNDVLDYRNAQMVNGKVYLGNANEPFSGKLTNVPDQALLIDQAGFQLTGKLASIALADSLPAAERNAQSFLGTSGAAALLFEALCDVQISDGLPDGRAICKTPQSDVVRIDTSFKHGSLDGSFALSGGQGNGVLMEVTFRNGRPDGTQKIYSWTNHKLIHTFPWSNGVASGVEEAFDANTGTLVKRATFVDGKYEGEVVHYSPDGKQVTIKATYTNGLLNGAYKEWGIDGTLIADKTYSNNVEVGADGSSFGSCMNEWDNAYRSSPNHRAFPPSHLQQQWEASCRAGQHPDPEDASRAAQAAKQAAAEVDRCVSAKKIAYRHDHGMSEGLAITDAQIMEFRQQCSAVAQSAMTPSASFPVSANPPGSSSGDICVSMWTAAFHRENGDDAIVTADQLGEWQSRCKDGKRPNQ